MVEQQTSFVIASRNRSAELSAPIGRLLDTTEFPIILVDNASHDDSAAVSRRAAAHAAGRLLVIRLDRDLGSAGRNVGVRACTTPYVAFYDQDSWWQPDATCNCSKLTRCSRWPREPRWVST